MPKVPRIIVNDIPCARQVRGMPSIWNFLKSLSPPLQQPPNYAPMAYTHQQARSTAVCSLSAPIDASTVHKMTIRQQNNDFFSAKISKNNDFRVRTLKVSNYHFDGSVRLTTLLRDSQHYCECNGTTPTSLWYWNHADTFLPNVWWSRDTAEDSGILGRVSLILLYLRNSLDVQLWFEPKNTTNGHRIGEIQPRELCAIFTIFTIFAGNAKLVFFANSSHQNVRPWPLIT